METKSPPRYWDGAEVPSDFLALQIDGYDLAYLNRTTAGEKVLSAEEFQAWVDLVAAAPKLLAALGGLLDWARENTSPRDANSPHALLVQAAEAIAAARGEG